MENASKALIMAAEILIGVMIISLGVYLFNVYSTYSSSQYSEIENTQIEQLNAKFLKYYGDQYVNGTKETIKCTIHDIVGVANLARETNISNSLVELKSNGTYGTIDGISAVASNNNFYIQIKLITNSTTYSNLELKTDDDLIEIITANDIDTSTAETIYFKCTKVGYSESDDNLTDRVNYMLFELY